MKRVVISIATAMLLLVALPLSAHAGDEDGARRWYADRAASVVESFGKLRPSELTLPQKFAVVPSPQGGEPGYALLVATWDERFAVQCVPAGNGDMDVKPAKNLRLPEGSSWVPISELCRNATPHLDITLIQRPLPVHKADKARNTFKVVVEDAIAPEELNEYAFMIFKPHKNAVKLSSHNGDVKREAEGNAFGGEHEYVFRLNDPSAVAKMFRGYGDTEMVPWIVKRDFFAGHHLLQFTRWKEGEPERKASRDACDIISHYYDGRRIVASKWLATCESAERSFYSVQFAHEGGEALAALVCIAEGMVVSSWEFRGTVDPKEPDMSIWFVDDSGDFIAHSPEIQCMVATEDGLELYVRVFGGESVQYYILREVGEVLMELQSDIIATVW